jgi:hypothetical protein
MSTTKVKILVNDLEIENIFREVENQVPVPFVSVTMNITYSDMLKKCKEDGSINPYYKLIKKVSTKTYRLVTDYQKRIWENLKKEGKDPNQFQVESPKGKRHVSKCLLTDTETETKRYVMLEWFPEIKGKTEFYHNGNLIDKMMFEKWEKSYESSNQKQGLDRNVTPITPLFESIVSFRVNGMEYVRG